MHNPKPFCPKSLLAVLLVSIVGAPPLQAQPNADMTSANGTSGIDVANITVLAAAPVKDPACANMEEYKKVPDDCRFYLHCEGGFYVKMPCAPGTEWDNENTNCTYPEWAKCVPEPSNK